MLLEQNYVPFENFDQKSMQVTGLTMRLLLTTYREFYKLLNEKLLYYHHKPFLMWSLKSIKKSVEKFRENLVFSKPSAQPAKFLVLRYNKVTTENLNDRNFFLLRIF